MHVSNSTHIHKYICTQFTSYVLIDRLSLHLTWETWASHKDSDTCCLNKRPKLDKLTLKPVSDVSVSSPGLFYDVSDLFVLPGFFLQARVFQRVTDSPYRPTRRVGVVFWSPRGSGARVMPPHVHPGWKVRTLRTECSGLLEKTCLLCSACLSLGKGWHRGGGGRVGEKERNERKKTSATEDKWQTFTALDRNKTERDREGDPNA